MYGEVFVSAWLYQNGEGMSFRMNRLYLDGLSGRKERKPGMKTYNDIPLDRCAEAGEVTFIRKYVADTYYTLLC